MYSGHQANVTFSVDTSNMSVIEGITGVVDGVGYVSHSFNQFIQVDNGTLVGSDHGDAYPRALVVFKYPTDLSKGNFVPSYSNKCKKYTMLSIPGRAGANYTGVSQGGFEFSDSSYLVAGNSDTNGEDSARNVFISSIPKDGGAATVRYFSDYAGTEDSAATPQLVKTGSNSFVLLWTSRGYVYYTAVDGNGQQVGSTHKMAGNLSDCVPTIADGKLIWYGWRNKNTVFYDISLSDLSVNHAVRIQNGHRYKYGAVAADGHVDETCSVCGYTEQLAVPTSVNYTFLFLDKTYVHMRDSMFLKSGNEYQLLWDYKFQNTSLKKISDLKITSSDPSVLQVEEEISSSEWAWVKALKSGKVTLTVQDKYNPEAKCSSEIYVDILERPAVYVSFGDRYANYDGTEHSVNVNMFSDMFKIEEGTDYQVTYDGDRVNAGTVKVTVTGIGKYSGTTTGEMVINPINVMNPQVSDALAADKYQYDGKEKKPGMVMSYQGMSLKEGKDYTLSYSNNVQPGTATVTVTGIGNYTGTLYRTFIIEGKPSEPTINPTKPSPGTVTKPTAKPSSTTKVIKLNDEVQIDKENSFHYNVTNAADKEDNSVVVDDNTVATDIAAYVNNIFSTLPEGFFVNGKIEITKNVVVDGVKKTVDDKFYATVFDDSGKAVSTVELKQNDKVTVTVPFSEDIKDTVTYAVKETDKNGNVLDKDSFAYVVSGEGSVKLNESDQYKGSIEITNTKKDATVTPGGSNGGSGTSNGGSDASSHGGSATSRPVKTGDPMNPAFWGLVLLVSVIVIAGGVVAYKKRKQK